ncbi:MAG: sporulation protein YqfD [Bacilli bacterium]|nr:sporulation protein YqfD [Bacilli bacterium]
MINRVKITITGKNPDYFLKELIKKNINIYDLNKNYKSITIIVDYSDYLKILELKTTYKIKLIKNYGISRIKEIIKRYLYFFIFSIIGIILSIILSNMIFKIEVIHPKKEIINLVEKDLKEFGLKKYHFKINYKTKEKIKRKILEKEKDKIEWLEIENIGTKYIIKVEERKIKKENKKCIERNIIAKKDSIILEIKSSKGEIIKKKLDYVNKGDVIISGFIYNKENIISKKCAVGTVYGEVWYKVKLNIPKIYKEEEKINKKRYGISMKILDKYIDINSKYKYYKKTNINILKSRIIPIELNFSKYQKLNKIKKIYTIDNINDISLSTAEKEINKKLKEEEKILSKKVLKKNIKNSKIEVEVFLKVKEDITDYQDISNINIEELNKKEEE